MWANIHTWYWTVYAVYVRCYAAVSGVRMLN